jgi:hypothetical protein
MLSFVDTGARVATPRIPAFNLISVAFSSGWGFTVVQSSSEEQPDRAIAQAITANINFFILLLF